MTFGWANLSMVLLKSGRDKMQCFCSDVLEKLSNKTSTVNYTSDVGRSCILP